MKRGHIYTFIFMVVITAVLVFALAAAYEAFKPSIQVNQGLQKNRAVLNALGLDDTISADEVSAFFAEGTGQVQPASLHGLSEVHGEPVLAYTKDGEIQAYAVPYEGSALWGSLRGYLGVTADLTKTTGLVFTYQNETPGLGGRIDETWYKDQFRGLPLAEGTKLSYGEQPEYKLDAITGATQTSQAVLRTVNKALAESIFAGEVK